jgi:hypothetical protein
MAQLVALISPKMSSETSADESSDRKETKLPISVKTDPEVEPYPSDAFGVDMIFECADGVKCGSCKYLITKNANAPRTGS